MVIMFINDAIIISAYCWSCIGQDQIPESQKAQQIIVLHHFDQSQNSFSKFSCDT